MTRSFADRPVSAAIISRMVDLATRSPSAGKTQGWHLLVLTGQATARFWDVTMESDRRSDFSFPGLLAAPVLALPLADPQAYVDRYAEPDKAHTGLGASHEAWPTPYWTVDTSMAVMTLLLAAEAEGLGALLFGIFHHEQELRQDLGIPDHLQLLGAIALGWPAEAGESRRGLSASRPRRQPSEIIHDGHW